MKFKELLLKADPSTKVKVKIKVNDIHVDLIPYDENCSVDTINTEYNDLLDLEVANYQVDYNGLVVYLSLKKPVRGKKE